MDLQDIAPTLHFKEKRAAPFTFLADENLEVVNLNGIYHTQHEEHGHIPYAVTFIVNPDGTVVWYFLGLKLRDRPKVEYVILALDAIVMNSR